MEPLKNTSQNIIKTSSNEDTTNSTLSSSTSKKDQYISFDISISNDPFNEMELKTINDLEELKTILHNHQLEQQQQMQAQQQQQIQELNNVDSSNHLISNHGSITTTNQLDNFGLPKISFVDFDINSNKLN